MSVKINRSKCVGCRQCVEVCPGNLIKIGSDRTAYIPHERDCWGCTSCIKECRFGAIDFFLGPDLEGRGTKLSVSRNENGYVWTFTDIQGHKRQISINAKDANRY